MRIALSLLSLAFLVTTVAHAQERVTTLEHGDWSSTIAALQADVGAGRTSVSVCVDPGDGSCAPCGQYTLALDEAGAAAFAIGQCDEATGATRLFLADRSALFDHDDVVPRPRMLTIHAALVHDVASSGGSAPTGGSALSCTARVQPFLRDLEHGTVIYLGPDRYDVRVEHAAVSASAIDDAWVLSTTERVETEVDYVVIERASGREELRGHTSLVCESETSTDSFLPAPPTESTTPPEVTSEAAPPSSPPPPADRSLHFSTRASFLSDFGFGRFQSGGAGAVGIRSWFDSEHFIGWSAELEVSGYHASCAAFDGRCNGAATAPVLSVDVLGFSLPFALRVAFGAGSALHVRFGLAPGLAYIYGSNGGHVDASAATGTIFAGLEYDLSFLVIGINASYRMLAESMGGDWQLVNGYGQAFALQSTVAVVF